MNSPFPNSPFPMYSGGYSSRMSHRSIIGSAAGIISLVVTVVTFVAVRVASSAQGCGFFCAPASGQPVSDSEQFVNTKWGFIIDYGGSQLTINQPDPTSDSADFLADDQKGNTVGEIVISAMPATNTQQAVQSALRDFSSDQFQDITRVEAVPGAEIGLIPGDGEGYSANVVSTDGSADDPVGIVIMASTHGNVTLVAAMWSETDTSGNAPFYLVTDQSFDYVLTDLHFRSG